MIRRPFQVISSNRLRVLIFLLLLALLPNTCHARLVVCVCPEAFQEAWQPWIEYRLAQGYLIDVIRPGRSAAGTREAVKKSALSRDLKAVVLLGDCLLYTSDAADE